MKLQQSVENLTMSSREIAELTGKEHGHVFRDIGLMLIQLGANETGYIQKWIHPQNKQKYNEYVLPKDLTMTLVSGYNVKLRKAIVDKWIELESKDKFQIPQTYSAALLLAGQQAEQLERQSEQLALAAPKVEFANRIAESTGNKTFREVAKLLKANEREFRAFLYENKFMYQIGGGWTARQNHINAGRFHVSGGEKNGHAFITCNFTPKGIEFIGGKWLTFTNSLNEEK